MDKEEIYRFLKANEFEFEWLEHKAVFNMAEMAEVEVPHPEAEAKNLFKVMKGALGRGSPSCKGPWMALIGSGG